MKKQLALWSLLGIVSAGSFAFSAEKRTPEEYWQRTGISTAQVLREHELLKAERCYKNLATFRGCLGALNALADRLEPKARFVPDPIAGDSSFRFTATLERHVGLSLVQLPAETIDREVLRVYWAKELEKRAKEDAAIKGLFEARASFPVDFESLAIAVLPRAVKDSKTDPLAASEMVSGYLKEAVDAHARIEAREEVRDSTSNADTSFFGVGMLMEKLRGAVLISSVFENSPAEKGGLRAKDQIQAVDGVLVSEMKPTDVANKIRGPEGSSVRIRVLRDGKEQEFSIVRAKIVQENLESKVVSDFGRRYGLIRLRSFMDDKACLKMRASIRSLQNEERVEGFILDLRNNGGGLLDQAVCMGGLFDGSKTVVKVRDLDSNNMDWKIGTMNKETTLPMVTLIDAGSASASEVLSGAFQDNERSWILGERSFGKGSVQAATAYAGNPRIMLWQTIQRFYQPKGRTNQIVGIMPNFVRPAKPDATEDDRFALRELDYYPNALGAESAPWVETRTAKVAQIESCVKATKAAEKKYFADSAAGKNTDYQLLSAQEVLGCDK